MGFVVIIILVLLLFFLRRFQKSNYQFKYDFITVFEGSLGSGKTTMLAYHTKKMLKKRKFQNSVANIVNKFILIKSWRLPLQSLTVYSNFPMDLGKFGWSKIINADLLDWSYKVEEGSIIVLDELGYLIPATKEVPSQDQRFTSVWLRHVLGKGCFIFGACQSISEVAIYFRRRCSHVYQLTNCRKGLFFSKVNVLDVYIAEDVQTMYNDTSKDFKDNVFRFKYPKNTFASDYGKNFYNLPRTILKNLKSYNDIFDYFDLKNGCEWNSLYIQNYNIA